MDFKKIKPLLYVSYFICNMALVLMSGFGVYASSHADTSVQERNVYVAYYLVAIIWLLVSVIAIISRYRIIVYLGCVINIAALALGCFYGWHAVQGHDMPENAILAIIMLIFPLWFLGIVKYRQKT